MRRSLVIALLSIVLWDESFAKKSCSISSVVSVSFGTYKPTNPNDTVTTGSLTVSCDKLKQDYTITLSRGSSSDFQQRTLRSNGNILKYNLFLDPSHQVIWGDGSQGSSLHTAVGSNPVAIYGKIYAGQPAVEGEYTDQILISVIFKEDL